ncbi:LysE family translocator [Thalassospira sp.]|uniref:LysE family translocator n=1 Tax=Thalassospira sp. TaxID=1912094 RepID=UPI002737195D|nr:LysE family translocator [Thalassospira sp.]MDP2698981.1 LysE family translocator [Thalassospira sp.]
MIDLVAQYGTFLVAVVLLSITPGPDMAYLLAQAATHGRRVGIMASLGVCSGAFVHVIAAALGLSAILATSAMAFAVVKWIGVAYLVWLGGRAIWQSFRPPQDDPDDLIVVSAVVPLRQPGYFRAWGQGVMIDIFNPKVALFFMAFLPQFVDPAHGDMAAQFLVLGLMVNVIGFIVECALVFAVAFMVGRFTRKSGVSVWLQRSLGGMLIALGARLALSDR